MRTRRGSFLDTLILAPWWISVAIAGIVFALCQLAPRLFHFKSPLFAAVNIFAAQLPHYAPYIALLFLFIALLSATGRLWRKQLLDRQTGLESIRELSWQKFELLIGEVYRRQGYVVTENGGGGADGGVDLRLRRNGETVIVQCKQWKTRQVGVSAIRELYGLMIAEQATGAIFVASGTYTSEAQKFAARTGVILVGGQELNALATSVQQSASGSVQTAKDNTVAPPCPTCGGETVLRTARRGKNVGNQFWGCAAYPECKGVVAATK